MYRLTWNIHDKSGHKDIVCTNSFVFGMRAAFATSQIAVLPYNSLPTFTRLDPPDYMRESEQYMNNYPHETYLCCPIVNEHKWNSFTYPELPPNCSFIYPDSVEDQVDTWLYESEECECILQVGNDTEEDGYILVAIPSKHDEDEYIKGFIYLHRVMKQLTGNKIYIAKHLLSSTTRLYSQYYHSEVVGVLNPEIINY